MNEIWRKYRDFEIKNGDNVLVLRKGKMTAKYCLWPKNMDYTVGKVGTVIGDTSNNDLVSVSIEGRAWSFHIDDLKKVKI